MNHSEIHLNDWIDVANHECVMQRLLPPGSPIGICTVVLNKTEPTTRITGWNGAVTDPTRQCSATAFRPDHTSQHKSCALMLTITHSDRAMSASVT